MADMTLSVKIIGDSTSLENAVDKAQGKLDKMGDKFSKFTSMSGKFKSIGAGLEQVGGAIDNVGSNLTNKITKPAIAAGGALAGVTLAKGWARMTEMDTAKAKLKAIGLTSEQVQKVSDDAYNAIAKSAYGMDEALTVATSGIATGLKEGTKEFNTYMNAVTGAASFAGTSMTEMGDVFTKVMAKGKASNEELSQMAEKSVPIYQWLAEEMGVSVESVMDMASKGQISYTDFANAVEKHTEGMAEAIGTSTIPGALGFISAGISRVGQAFLGTGDDANTFSGKVIPLLMAVYNAMDPIVEKAGELGAAFAEKINPYVDKAIGFLDRFANGALTETDQNMLKTVGSIAGFILGIGPMIAMVGKGISLVGKMSSTLGMLGGEFGTTGMTGLQFVGQIGKIAGIAAIVIAALVGMYQNSESFRGAVNELVGTALQSLKAIIEALKPVFESLMEVIPPILEALGNAMTPMIKILTRVIQILTPIIVMLVEAFGEIVGAVAPVIEKVAELYVWFSDKLLSAMDWVGEKLDAVGEWFGNLATKGEESSKRQQEALKEQREKSAAEWEAMKAKAGETWDNIKSKVSTSWEDIKSKTSNAATAISGKWTALKTTASTVWDGIKTTMTSKVEEAKEKVKGILDKLKSFFPISVGKILSNIKLPHFTIKGKFSINPPSMPKIGVSWYAKGGIFDMPSVIGVGEGNEPEAVTPISKLKGYIQEAITNAPNAMPAGGLDSLANALSAGLAMNNAPAGGEYTFVVELGGVRVAEQIFKLNREGEMIMRGA